MKVKDDSTVKVLDFGLAKALDPSPTGDPSQSPTLTAAATQMGVIMGTAAYMSPEQAKGKVVDKRADVWAFGAVIYEMLTGARPFAGDDVSETLARVIDREPDWTALPDNVSPVLSSFLRRCLQKNPKKRIRDIGDVSLAIEGAFDLKLRTPAEPFAPSQLQVWQRPIPAAIVAVTLVVVSSLAAWILTRPEVIMPDLMRFAIVPPETAPMAAAPNVQSLTISPDGTQVAYSGPAPDGVGAQLNLRPIDQLLGAPLRGEMAVWLPSSRPTANGSGL